MAVPPTRESYFSCNRREKESCLSVSRNKVCEVHLFRSVDPRRANMATNQARKASLHLNDRDNPTLVRVSLPSKITEPELAKLTAHIVQDIVRPHTGCTCLSGKINVLYESVFQEAVQVEV
jgi:hypothetical protein